MRKIAACPKAAFHALESGLRLVVGRRHVAAAWTRAARVALFGRTRCATNGAWPLQHDAGRLCLLANWHGEPLPADRPTAAVEAASVAAVSCRLTPPPRGRDECRIWVRLGM
jgi:hypothetical protein